MIDEENQTQFAQEEPLLERSSLTAEDMVQDPALLKKQQFKKNVMFAIGAVLVLFISLVLVGLTARQQVQQVVVAPSPSATTQQAQNQGELDTTLNLLHEDVSKADPSVNDLPVPPVDFKLTLEKDSF